MSLNCSESLHRLTILRKWKELKGVEATYGKLLRLCCENEIQSIAESICNMLRSRGYGETCVGDSNTLSISVLFP